MRNGKMQIAIEEAKKALSEGEVPVGAAIFFGETLICRAHNETVRRGAADAHAELLALRRASEALGDWRLGGCELYVTLEPCAMCCGAVMLSKLSRLYFGAYDAQNGACGGKIDIVRENLFGSNLEVYGGICEEECRALLRGFFRDRRKETKEESTKEADFCGKNAR